MLFTINLVGQRNNGGKPIMEFVEFVQELEKQNWVSDTIRVESKNLYSLEKKSIKLFNQNPFYKIELENTDVIRAFNSRPYNGKFADSLDVKLVGKVKSIWSYFYKDSNAKNMITDGVIEQWEYENEGIAEKVFVEIDNFKYIVYFNTEPYLCRKGKYIFIFHTRAMAFSYKQKNIYETFINNEIHK